MSKQVKNCELFESVPVYMTGLFEGTVYPWEVLHKIGSYLERLLANMPAGFSELTPGVWVGENVQIASTATILPPAIIGTGTEIRPGAYLRGNVITGEKCVIGNSTELKNTVLLDCVQIPHYNYVGDSVLGNFAHMGAGAVCSNLKSDGKPVIIHADTEYETGIRKIGGILGDHADIGCGCVMNPGTVVGKNTSVYPLTSLRGVYPGGCIVKSPTETVKRI